MDLPDPTPAASAGPSDARRPGRLTQALVRLFVKQATIVDSEVVSPTFYILALESPQFRSLAWTPGQKVQIMTGSSFASRTYTPIEWDAVAGRTRLVAYAHGDGPGSDWVRGAKVGDTCEVFGPRASLQVTTLSRPAAVFGDETSLALAISIEKQAPTGSTQYLFEVNSADAAQPVLAEFGMGGAELFVRRPDDRHLGEIEQHIVASAAAGATFVLTGKSTSIQRLRGLLRTLDVPSSRIMTKAYWAPGKTGLD